MSQASITSFFGVRKSQKRKCAGDEAPLRKKLAFEDVEPVKRFESVKAEIVRAEPPKTLEAAVQNAKTRPDESSTKIEPKEEPPKALEVVRDAKTRPDEPSTTVKPKEEPSTSESSKPSRSEDVAPRPAGVARKRASLERIKKALASSDRLGELKSKMAAFNQSYDKLKAAAAPSTSTRADKSSLREFAQIDVLVPTSPSKRTPTKLPSIVPSSPIKDTRRSLFGSPTKVPAHLRFHSLVESTPTLALPHHYRWLAEVFRAVETAASMLHNRGDAITFAKIKPAAQEMLKRNVAERHLSQIARLGPQMYTFAREKSKRAHEHELVLTPLLAENTFTPEEILRRRRAFYAALVDRVKDHHEKFLLSLDPPLTIDRRELTRWHPEFDLERIPDVEGDPTFPPEPPVEKYTSARDVLSRAKEMFSDARVQRAVERLATKKATEGPTAPQEPVTPTADIPKFVNPALRNVPDALLQRVKARQAEKASKAMTSSQSEDSLARQKLPDLARTLRNLFLAEKKGILSIDSIVPKLENSFNGKISNADLLKHLKLLASETPEWLTIHTVRKTEFIKIAKYSEFTKIISKLEESAKACDD